MKTFNDFLNTIEDPEKRARISQILDHIRRQYPQLQEEIKWSQPMFSDHGTFIIGFSLAKGHIAVAPEAAGVIYLEEDLRKAGYTSTRELFRIKWDQAVDYEILDKVIDYNIEEKKGMTKYWR